MSNNPYGNPYVLRLLSRTMAIITITTEAMAMKQVPGAVMEHRAITTILINSSLIMDLMVLLTDNTVKMDTPTTINQTKMRQIAVLVLEQPAALAVSSRHV